MHCNHERSTHQPQRLLRKTLKHYDYSRNVIYNEGTETVKASANIRDKGEESTRYNDEWKSTKGRTEQGMCLDR